MKKAFDNRPIKFRDSLYGEISLPYWLNSFIFSPEFVRLRYIRLSNVDSFYFKDFANLSRWEHSLGVAYLASTITNHLKVKGYGNEILDNFLLASLYHDIGTPPFAHTIEKIITSYDHEQKSYDILMGSDIDFTYKNKSPCFPKHCEIVNKKYRKKLDPEKIVSLINGRENLGYLLNGTIDIDNIDNLTRANNALGFKVSHSYPLDAAVQLVNENRAPLLFDDGITPPWISTWKLYRKRLYEMFFTANDNELAREAFLRYIIKNARKFGFKYEEMIWNTDEQLLSDIRTFAFDIGNMELGNFVNMYQLLQHPLRLDYIDVSNDEDNAIFSNSSFMSEVETDLENERYATMFLYHKKRYKDDPTLLDGDKKELFNDFTNITAILHVFYIDKLLANSKLNEICINLNNKIFKEFSGGDKIGLKDSGKSLRAEIRKFYQEWERFNINTDSHKKNIISNLENYGNWGFKNTINDNLHSYPATFVQSIPNAIIRALSLDSPTQTVFDPFAGTGQTISASILNGCNAIASELNYIAYITMKAKFTYLPNESFTFLERFVYKILNMPMENEIEAPKIPNCKQWFHIRTLKRLSLLHREITYICDEPIKNFLLVAFSSILTSCTQRRGENFSYFADNTPLPKDTKSPDYVDPMPLFAARVEKNIKILYKFYASIKDKNLDIPTKSILDKIKIKNSNSLIVTPEEFAIEHNSISAIITSPPYLCMADYSLALRLSYYWLNPEKLQKDFELEIGSRRSRTNPKTAYDKYFNDIKILLKNANNFIKDGGYFVSVLGAPCANAFKEKDIYGEYEEIFKINGYEQIWSVDRHLHWHRNRKNDKLTTEKIHIFLKKS